ncbi:hypothetical protein VWX97_19975 [Phaeobacter sp. JH18-32]
MKRKKNNSTAERSYTLRKDSAGIYEEVVTHDASVSSDLSAMHENVSQRISEVVEKIEKQLERLEK